MDHKKDEKNINDHFGIIRSQILKGFISQKEHVLGAVARNQGSELKRQGVHVRNRLTYRLKK